MERVFEHFHLNMVESKQGDLLLSPLSRERWLRQLFTKRFEFQHLGKTIHWVPHASETTFLLGTVERIKPRRQHRGPDEGAEEFTGEEWQGSLVIIDPEHRPDGQKLAFEYDRDVGQPNALLDSIVGYINSSPQQYTIVVKSLFNAETFRSFARKHGQVVKYVRFNFVVPNMFFGTSTSVDQGLRRIGAATKAQTVTLGLESDKGVQADSAEVEDALDYAEAGNASVTSKAMNGETYSSTSRRKTVRMQSILNMAVDTKEAVKGWLSRALGRETDDSLDGTASSGRDAPLS